ncbi:MAG: circumsporozoite protein- membrane associated protein, partial [Planctomycetota bacterium]
MSTAAPPPPANPASTTHLPAAKGTKSDRVIEDRITEACRALWWAEVTRACLRVVLVAMSCLLVWLIMDQWFYSPGILVRTLVWLGVLVAGAAYLWKRVVPLLRSQIRPEYAARSLERDMPDLRQSLTSYVTLREQPNGAGLRGRVVRSMGAATAGRLRTFDELPTEATGTLRWWVATAAAFAVLVAYAVISPKNSFQSAARLAAPLAAIDPPRRVSISDVLPGDSEAIAGRTVAISAVIDGMQQSETAVCRYSLPAEDRELPLVWDESDRRYHAEIALPYSVSGRVPYTIEAGDAQSGPYYLSVQDLPVVALQSVYYAPPAYTGQQPHTTSSGEITALDGTFVTVTATTNRAVEKAKIEFNPRPLGERMQATAGATEMKLDESGTQLTVTFPLKSARGRSAAVEPDSYRIQVTDAAGQTNPDPIVYPIRVIADLPPEVSITLPFESPTDVEISAQQIIEVHGSDPDFGLKTIGLELRSGIDTIATPILWEHETGGKGNQVVEFAFRPTQYKLRIGDEVQVVAVAIDNRVLENDPSVEPNITRTDPVVLKIVAGDPNQPNDPNDDPPPQRNDGSQKQSDSDQSSQSGQGEEQSGQGGGGGSGESSGQAQSDQNQGEGGSGQGTNEQSNPSDSQDGSGGGGENQQNASDNQDPSGSGSEGGQAGNDGTPPGDSQQQSGEAGEGSMDNQSQSGDPQNGEGNAGEATADQTAEGTGTEGGNANANQQASNGSEGASAGQPDSSERQGSGQGQGDSSREAPKHDGETFERIRDYLERERQKQQESDGGSDSNQSQNPQSQDPQNQSGESGRNESQSGDPQSGDPQSGDPQSGDPQSGDPQSGDPQSGDPQSGDPQSGDPQSGDPQSGDPQSGDPQSGDPQSGDPQSGDPQSGD